MALSSEATAVKNEMLTALLVRRELETLETEWQELLFVLEEQGETADYGVLDMLNEQRAVLRRQLTERQVRNWARITAGDLSPLQRRVLGLRYVRGCPWSDVVRKVGKVRQYLFREHNKALEKLVFCELSACEKQGKNNLCK